MYMKGDWLNRKFCEVVINKKFKFSYHKYIEFQMLENFLGNFVQKMGFVYSIIYSMIILGTDENLNILEMSKHLNIGNSWVFFRIQGYSIHIPTS